MMRVSELMTPAPVQVGADTPIATCALRMHHLGIRHLPVVRGDGQLSGVLTDSAVLARGAVWDGAFHSSDRNAALTAADVAEPVEVVVHTDDELPPVLRRLAQTRQDCVVVVDDRGHPVGIVTEHDLLKVALLVVPESLTVDRLPRRPVITCNQTDLASVALEAMIRNQIRHIPVLGPDGSMVGVVSLRDLVSAGAARGVTTLDGAGVWDVFTASSGDTLVSCATRMLDFHVGCLPVVEGGRVVRMVTRRDLVNAAAEGLEEEGLFEGDDSASTR